MRKMKWIMGLALGMGIAMTCSAQDRYWDRRDLRQDYRQVDQLRAQVMRDRWQLNEDLRCGRRWAAYQDRHQLERDERALAAVSRDMRYDRRDLYRDDWRDRRW
jgi:hypothetical protein